MGLGIVTAKMYSTWLKMQSNTLRYRVEIWQDSVTVNDFDGILSNSSMSGIYGSPTDLPKWMQRSIAALHICQQSMGVGMRLTDNVFWLEEESALAVDSMPVV